MLHPPHSGWGARGDRPRTDTKEIDVKNLGQSNVTARRHPDGGWCITLPCPLSDCSASAVVFSDAQQGPYTGACSKRHSLAIPHFPAS